MAAVKLHATKDRKVSPRGYYRGVYRGRDFGYLAATGNSFGLPSGITCPGKTGFCASCYGARTEQYANVRTGLWHNLGALHVSVPICLLGCTALVPVAEKSLDEQYWLIYRLVERFQKHARKHIERSQWIFRIHWDGDFFSDTYARAWGRVIMAFPEIKFWCYTRSFFVVKYLHYIENLVLYLSVDEWNVDQANIVAAKYPQVKLALCAVDYQVARTLVERPADKVAIPCPENSRKIGLNDDGVGACVTCMICPDARRDILFSTSHRENAQPQQVRLELTRKKTT